MGIDIYMRWQGITEPERDAQVTGFSVESGDVGYLREAYHGEPYATRLLVAEAFEKDAEIPAATLRQRLPETLLLVAERHRSAYHEELVEGSPTLRAFVDFVELAERVEARTGQPVTIIASW